MRVFKSIINHFVGSLNCSVNLFIKLTLEIKLTTISLCPGAFHLTQNSNFIKLNRQKLRKLIDYLAPILRDKLSGCARRNFSFSFWAKLHLHKPQSLHEGNG